MSRTAPNNSSSVFRARWPLALRVVGHNFFWLLLSIALVIGLGVLQFRHSLEKHADTVGHSMAEQAAIAATDAMLAKDNISLNILLNRLSEDPLVAMTSIQDARGVLVAQAGQLPEDGLFKEERDYEVSIRFQGAELGKLRLTLAMQEFQLPMVQGLRNLAIAALVLLVLGMLSSWLLARRYSVPLKRLTLWLSDLDGPPPGMKRNDEIGALAKQLQAQLSDMLLIEPDDSEAADLHLISNGAKGDSALGNLAKPDQGTIKAKPAESDATANADRATGEDASAQAGPDTENQTAVLAVRLDPAQLRRLGARVKAYTQYFERTLQRVARLYRGELCQLDNDSYLVLFHVSGDENYLTNAICCGELLRALIQAMQMQAAGMLKLQLGLAVGPNLEGMDMSLFGDQQSVQNALKLCSHSHNLLLMDPPVTEDPATADNVRMRQIANPPGVYCVERLRGRYGSLLARHFQRLQSMKH